MESLKSLLRAILILLKQVLMLPQSVRSALEQRRQQNVRDELEVERLDRIRNPSKYLGK